MCAVIALSVAGCKGDTPVVDPVNPVGEKPEISVQQMDLTANSFTFEISTNVAGELGYAVVAEGYNAPSINDLFAANSVQVDDVEVITVEGLNDNTEYTLYVIFRAAADGLLSDPKTLKFTTPDDGVDNPVSIDNVTFDTITFTINIAGSYVFQCIDKAYIEYSNITIEEYITMPGIGIPSSGLQTVNWYDGGAYGSYEMRVREDSDYYVVAAIANGQTVVGDIYVVETRTPKRPTSTAGLTTELLDVTSTSVNIKTTPDSSVVEYYVLVRDKAWSDSIISGYGESMLATLVMSPSAGSWHLTAANEAVWSGLSPKTEYVCHIVVKDNLGAQSLSLVNFETLEATAAAPVVEASLTTDADAPHNKLNINIFSENAASVRVAFNAKADIDEQRANGLSDSAIVESYGMNLSAEQVEAVRTTGLSLKMEDLFPEVEYEAVVGVLNAERTETVVAAVKTTSAKALPTRVESDLFTTLLGEWEVSYSLIQYNMQSVEIKGEKVTIAQGVDAKTNALYRDHNRLVIVGWPFSVSAQGIYEPIPHYSPADLMDASSYWKNNPALAYRDYGPKIFLEIGAGDVVSVPSERGEYFYNWSTDGTFYFFGCDYYNQFTAPASFPVTVMDGGDTLVIGASEPCEEFGYGVYRPSVFRDSSMWSVATSDIVLKRVK